MSRSLAARAEGKEAAERLASDLAAEACSLREQLSVAVEAAEELGSKARAAEDEAGAMAGKLGGLEKVVRRLGGEAEVCRGWGGSGRSGRIGFGFGLVRFGWVLVWFRRSALFFFVLSSLRPCVRLFGCFKCWWFCCLVLFLLVVQLLRCCWFLSSCVCVLCVAVCLVLLYSAV